MDRTKAEQIGYEAALTAHAMSDLNAEQDAAEELDKRTLSGASHTAYFLKELSSLRDEVLQSQWFLVGCTLVVLVLMLMWSDITNDSKIVLIGSALPYVLSRFDYLIKRAGLYLKNVGSMWERSPERDKMKWILAISDVGCLFPILGMWLYSEQQSYLAGNTFLVFGTSTMMIIGIATFITAASQVSKDDNTKK